ncbi:uncharacterized protein J3D65DRAFT_612059 [Phyllosticta citribraziliensis]|uniref:Secreted protein n=1 Tax=Phyllosticta citribraziliensis TaxID=989973 RepID=A0ABR1M2Y3_9PEZI
MTPRMLSAFFLSISTGANSCTVCTSSSTPQTRPAWQRCRPTLRTLCSLGPSCGQQKKRTWSFSDSDHGLHPPSTTSNRAPAAPDGLSMRRRLWYCD